MSSSPLAVIATYNENPNISSLVLELLELPLGLDILIVDDNSPDGTGELVRSMASKNPRVHVLNRPQKQGLAPALIAGFEWALERPYQIVVNLDGDHSHNPRDISAMLKALADADLIVGSRYCHGVRVMNWPVSRLALSLLAGSYIRLITGIPVQDPTSGFRCFRRRTLEQLNLRTLRSHGYFFHIETLSRAWRQGSRIIELPITFNNRPAGVTKLSKWIIIEAFVQTFPLCMDQFKRRPGCIENELGK